MLAAICLASLSRGLALYDVSWGLPVCEGGRSGYIAALSPGETSVAFAPLSCGTATGNLSCSLSADGLLSAHGVYQSKYWSGKPVKSGCSRNDDDHAECCFPTDTFKCDPTFKRCMNTLESGNQFKYDCDSACSPAEQLHPGVFALSAVHSPRNLRVIPGESGLASPGSAVNSTYGFPDHIGALIIVSAPS